jgi:hypothetical protein
MAFLSYFLMSVLLYCPLMAFKRVNMELGMTGIQVKRIGFGAGLITRPFFVLKFSKKIHYPFLWARAI